MAHYTITIKNLIKNNFDFKLTDYPIFDETYRNTLNNKILYHYYEDEIAFETPALFRIYLNNQMSEIMPYYNELYKIQKQILDDNLALYNVDLKEAKDLTRADTSNGKGSSSYSGSQSQNGETSSTTNSKSSNTQNTKTINQDTPQGKIHETDVDNANWASRATLERITNSGSQDVTSTGSDKNNITSQSSQNQTIENALNGTENYIKTLVGANGNKYKIELLSDVKNNIMNIDLLIINDLSDLFMGIW